MRRSGSGRQYGVLAYRVRIRYHGVGGEGEWKGVLTAAKSAEPYGHFEWGREGRMGWEEKGRGRHVDGFQQPGR